jgi:hypothetical protein
VLVSGSLKSSILGGAKVKTAKSRAIMHSAVNAIRGTRKQDFPEFNRLVSKIYAIAAETKKIAIFS